ncbi:metabotropic glutamate receptor 6 isoform X1 [Cimex lectularius]|uniref:G-protein coupled receptors family 3 profile domain-containing protein n=1 Tax=Cimex lectularius TaxID=79782 RepID=A0A8I6TBF6_CIMLE|nr:metabotropic glutamate receptor 6 isoform X1 [Cimex lectularius]
MGGVLEMSTEFFLVPRSSTPDPPRLVTAGPTSVPLPSPSILRTDMWVLPLLVFSTITMLLIAIFEVFVVLKTYRTTPSRRHLFLGQMLLLGLFLCSAVSAILTAQPTVLTCAAVRLGAGLAYTLVFSTLLVKCVFLISLNGGVYLPAPYQALLLFFAVLIQLTIGVQWLINSPPKIIQQVGGLTVCQTPYHHILLSLVYTVFLIVVVGVLALKSRGIRDNYREATFIGLATACVIPVWLGWALCGLVVLERNRDACLAFGLSASALVVFLVMFMPKGRQLAAMGKEGMYLEDREDKLSSLSRPASPSFFHFKPVAKQHPVNTFDRVALVAPPPSYGHHYYPYCYFPRPLPGGASFDTSMYTTVERTMSTNPNVFFHRSSVHPGMMY